MIRLSLAIIMMFSVAWAKQPDKPAPVRDKNAELSADRKKLVEKIKGRKGTNDVWQAGREFPLMFKPNQKKPKK